MTYCEETYTTLYHIIIRDLHVKHFHAVKNNIFISSIEYLHERSELNWLSEMGQRSEL